MALNNVTFVANFLLYWEICRRLFAFAKVKAIFRSILRAKASQCTLNMLKRDTIYYWNELIKSICAQSFASIPDDLLNERGLRNATLN